MWRFVEGLDLAPRAAAGATSFRRRATLSACHRQAKGLRRELAAGPAAASRRQAAARQRAAAERERRAAEAIYKERTAAAERINAQARNRGLTRFLVRGLAKVKAVVTWHALAPNRVCTWRLAAA